MGCRAVRGIDELELLGDVRKASLDVAGNRVVQLAQAVGRVVELRDDVLEARRRDVGEVVLELRERTADVIRLLGLADHVARGVALEELVDAPRILVGNHFEGLHALRLQELRHADDVRLEEVHVEDGRVHALQYVARARGRLDLVRLVDVPAAVAAHVGRVDNAGVRKYFLLFFGHYLRPFFMTGICAAATD